MSTESSRPVILPSAAPRAIEWAAERLATGGVIALPTDTVYGIAASLSHEEALQRIYAIKGRPAERTLPVLVSSTEALVHVAEALDDDVVLLLDRYWPGPLTIVVSAKPGMPSWVTAADGTVGVRLPNHPLAIEVIDRAGGAIACTSANLSGAPPCRAAADVAAVLGDQLDLILDGGITPGGVPSTVVAVRGNDLHVLRDGAIPSEHLLATWRELRAGA